MSTASLRIRRAFDRAARIYDHGWLQRIAYRPGQDAVVAELCAAGSRRVLDVGCGTGILATLVRQRSRDTRVVGCDLSLGMLRRAAERVRGTWLQADALRLPLRDGVLDAVVSTQAFHFIPDRPAALREFHRVLEPGGLLVIAMINPRSPALSRLMNASARRALGAGTWPAREVLREEVDAAGFEVHAQRDARDLARTVVTVATARRTDPHPEG
ncbi:MAG TPA: methyltransferase domain-containing protein [Candidatus Dormibacteraeota bacterium]|jgi:ubiquinone/menaquinone biosynthesis C-methylase UbiE|nr:methyltransferase domain-containing protein [Candidatus Dormibacteraeota bacterium]